MYQWTQRSLALHKRMVWEQIMAVRRRYLGVLGEVQALFQEGNLMDGAQARHQNRRHGGPVGEAKVATEAPRNGVPALKLVYCLIACCANLKRSCHKPTSSTSTKLRRYDYLRL